MNELQTTNADDPIDAGTAIATSAAIENPSLMLFDTGRMRALMKFATVMADSAVTVPKHLQGKPSDCLAITLQAMRWRMDPYVVAGKTHVVNGNLGYEAQLVVAVLKNSGAVKGRPHFEYRGDGPALECRAGFVPADEDEILWTEWIRNDAIQVKNSPLWKTNPKQQLGYLQARNWARLYAPDALLGVYTVDEFEDSDGAPPQVPRGPQRKSAATPPPMVEEVPKAEQQQTGAASAAQASAAPAAASAPAEQPTDKPKAPPAINGAGISGGQVAYLRNKLKAAGLAEQAICDRFQVGGIELLSAEAFDEIKSELLAMA